ncbi:hypothetical protein L1987_58457 [Smallanthus sonchifolius]|uniref:Uncharacterized protein n=1 Tax=Smallanthus sonchifolius TaxID=185202 RepID=A0ACB9DGE6_9ASTR|nr:hypothetical protein L1987_58457 [Smallanthus sonchifolius]
MGFPARWCSWVKGCLDSGRGSVLVNGSPSGEFPFKRGLRQGDPLSPFLFILALEALSMFMNKALNLGLLQGIRLPNNGPIVSHLCYADDVIFLGPWSERNLVNLIRLLRCFQLVTGLKVNPVKSSLFGVGVDDSDVARVAKGFNCKVGKFPFIYLGLPIGANMKRVKHWSPVIDRFNKRLSSWKAKSLSFAGRVTLAKAVLGSLPSYYLSLFRAPVKVVKSLESIRRAFVWGKSDSGNKIRWVTWDKVIKPRKLGGLGLGGIKDFNDAMLAKCHVIRGMEELEFGVWSWASIKVPKSSSEQAQYAALSGLLQNVALSEEKDRWFWPNNYGVYFSVKGVRENIVKAGHDGCLNP